VVHRTEKDTTASIAKVSHAGGATAEAVQEAAR